MFCAVLHRLSYKTSLKWRRSISVYEMFSGHVLLNDWVLIISDWKHSLLSASHVKVHHPRLAAVMRSLDPSPHF